MKIHMKWMLTLCTLTSFLLVSCSTVSQEEEIDDEEQVATYLFQEELLVRTMEIIDKDQTIELSYKNGKWETVGLDNPDELSIDLFIEELAKLRGILVEYSNEIEHLFETSITVIKMESSVQENVTIEINEEEREYFAKINDQVFLLENPPQSLQQFDRSYLEKPIPVRAGNIHEIIFDNDGEKVVLNQRSNMRRVETAPFISGWYLHEVYETNFSIEYQWMDSLLESFSFMRGEETDQIVESVHQIIYLMSDDYEEVITIGHEVGDYHVAHVKSEDAHFLIPANIVQHYQFEPLDIVDNFVALIPLDVVQEIHIESETDLFIINAEHEIVTDEEDIGLSSTFYFNGEEIEEQPFRRMYQYLARLSYSTEYNEEFIDQDSSGIVSIVYSYLSEGELVQKSIELVPINEKTEYVVIVDGEYEFKMDDKKLEEMLEEFRKM